MSGSRSGALAGFAKRIGISLDEYNQRVSDGEKWCTSCKAWQPKAAFASDRSRYDGLTAVCRESRKANSRVAYAPKPRERGKKLVAPRLDDRKQARRRVNHLVDVGLIPDPNDLPCTDCGHVFEPASSRHEYDHHLGYTPEHHESVQAVCSGCHHRRELARKVPA